MKGLRHPCALTAGLLMPAAALAQAETTSFSYDALGRVIEAESTASGDTITNSYSYDAADNRTSATVTDTGTLAAPPQLPPDAPADPPDEPERK